MTYEIFSRYSSSKITVKYSNRDALLDAIGVTFKLKNILN